MTKNIIIRAKLNDDKRTYRDIAVTGQTTLYDLASYVVDAFGFDFDHCFGFFSSPDIFGKAKDSIHYELFYDIGEEIDTFTESVEQTKTSDLFGSTGDKWWMLFDYGDGWVFELELRDGNAANETVGAVLRSKGDPPEQYPDRG